MPATLGDEDSLLIEKYIESATKQPGCADYASKLLDATNHLVRAKSVATAAEQCVFMARLAETLGIRGSYRSVLPGKGEVIHLALALAFPEAFRESVRGGKVDFKRNAERALEALKANGVLDSERLGIGGEDEVVRMTAELARSGVEFARKAFEALAGDEAEEALSRSRVIVEQHLISYRLHVWAVPDVIVEDPVGRYAAVIEWKTYAPNHSGTPEPDRVDLAQAYVYAMVEAERLGLVGDYQQEPGRAFDDYVYAVLGREFHGRGARVIPGIVRPSPTGRASRIVVKHPLLCMSKKESSCDYSKLKELLARIVLAAEHLTLSLTNPRRHLKNAGDVEAQCSVRTKGGMRPIFRRVPSVFSYGRIEAKLPRGYPTRTTLKWPCLACPGNVREACSLYVMKGGDLYTADFAEFFKVIKKEAWRARFAIYSYRENALAPYKSFREKATKQAPRFGSDMAWIKRGISTRVLSVGSGIYRLDLFDEAHVDGDELVLARRPLHWEIEKNHLFTLREGKPAAVFLNEENVRDPLLRVSFHGTVSSVSYNTERDMVEVRVAPANRPSRVYPIIFERYYNEYQQAFYNVVALEVNVELTQLELLGVTGWELGTAVRGARALEKARSGGEDLEDEDKLALLFGGVKVWLDSG